MNRPFAVVCLLLIAFTIPGCSSRKTTKKTSATKPPSVKVTVNRVQRMSDGNVEIQLVVPEQTSGPHPLAVEYKSLKVGMDSTGASAGAATIADIGGARAVQTTVKVPPSVKQVTIAVQLKLMEQAHFKFTNLSPGALPVRKKSGGITAVVRAILVNRIPDRIRWPLNGIPDIAQPKKPAYALEVETFPAFLCESTYSYRTSKNGAGTSWSQRFDDHEDYRARLTDDRGHTYKTRYSTYDSKAADARTDVFMNEVDRRTMFERATRIVSWKLAGKMVDRRARTTARTYANRDIYIYGFPAITPPPRKCSFEFTAYGPGPTIWVTLKNQPILPAVGP
jgi:hypothetical protein